MENVDDLVDFEDGRHGWENDLGSLDGTLEEEDTPTGKNTFWSGRLKAKYPQEEFEISASLAKMFFFSGEGQQDGMFSISFDYRVHWPEQGEAIRIYLMASGEVPLGYSRTLIDERTPVDEWLQFPLSSLYYARDRMTPVLIGAHGSLENHASSRKIDIDNIRVVELPVKK
ncbi:hypothetical protein [Pseudomonas sp. SWRI154]|uniref:hypothetical protein n=1 Tax=Pseudomonas sp. SWRI154 TaxID=2745501 RepID=UPI00164972CF|nr:hypothetical protein [Pseudomonas sp. SWRI154]MBC3362336.1 hypothetical protein [Pseudomonas sp. SWRI154]